MNRRIVVICVDATEASKDAVRWAARFFLRPSDVVVLTAAWEETTQKGFFSRQQQQQLSPSSASATTTPRDPAGAAASPRGSTGGASGASPRQPSPRYQHHLYNNGGNGSNAGLTCSGSFEGNGQQWEAKQAMVGQFYREHLSACDVFPLFIPLQQKMTKAQVGEVLCSVAAILKATFVVVGTNSGKTALKRFIVGSVSKFVVEHTTCPVLVVKH